MANAGFLYAAFTIVWVVLFGFVLVLLNKQSKIKREIDLLKAALKDKDTN